QSRSTLSGVRSRVVNSRAAARNSHLPSFVAEEMEDREIELARVLQEGEVAHVRQNEQAGVRDGRGDVFCMRPLDRFVMVAVDNENGRVDRLELIVGPV